jgi:sodium-dependent phosphate cotransporter
LETVKFLAALYFFLLSIALLGAAFKLFGADFSKALIESTTNPFVGLFIGILATSIVQSSSATTSMVVTLVAAGSLTTRNAVPIIMGANIGTTVTCALVSLGHITRKEEFRRAMSGALVHDFFNLMAVGILLPVELVTGWLSGTGLLQWAATGLSRALTGTGGVKYQSPLKAILKPVAKKVVGLFSGLGDVGAGVIVLVIALVLLFVMLYFMSKIMRRVIRGRAEAVIDRTIGRSALVGLTVGVVITALVQSSSVTTSILVPLAGAGILTVEQIFPITLGANVGTTVTALLAALATIGAKNAGMEGNEGLTIALAHLLFNACGILLIYPVPAVRALPIRMAKGMANLAAESKRYAFLFVAGTFFVAPGLLILVTRLF